MEKIVFKNNQEPALDENTLNALQGNIETHRYSTTLETELADNSQITVPNYKVGTDSLQVYFEGCLLEKDIHYTEVRRSKQHK